MRLPRDPGPPLPDWVEQQDLEPAVRAALKGLDPRNAATVGRHLIAAGGLVDDDPETALAHARAARDRASRVAAVREAVGVAAYHAGEFAEAARELRAYRRMSGDEAYRAVLADCERAQGRPDVALRLVAEALATHPDRDETVELRLVEAGARQDLGELAAAVLVLESALGGRPQPAELGRADLGRLRLATAYADALFERGDEDLAMEWFGAIAAADPDDLTGVSDRFGTVIEDDDDEAFDDDDEEDEDDEAVGDVEGVEGSGDDGDRLDRSGVSDGVPARAPGGDEQRADAPADGPAGDLPHAGDGAPLGGGDGAGEQEDHDAVEEAQLVGYDPDEDDVEAEVAELLGEGPPRGALVHDHNQLFQAAPLPDDEPEQTPPTD